jgi:hypothetical protein
MADAKKEVVVVDSFRVVDVATQTSPGIMDVDGKFLSVEAALAKVLNDLELLKKGLL